MTTSIQRTSLLSRDTGLDWILERARAAASAGEPEFNLHFWTYMGHDVARAHVAGLAADPRVVELASLVREQITDDRIVSHRVNVVADGRGRRIDTMADRFTLGAQADGLMTRGLVTWLATAERSKRDFDLAASASADLLEAEYGHKVKMRAESVDQHVMLLTLAERPADIQALFARPQLASRAGGLAKARTPMDIGRAWATGDRNGLFAAAERVHASSVRKCCKDGNWGGLALAIYFTAFVRKALPAQVSGVQALFAAAAIGVS